MGLVRKNPFFLVCTYGIISLACTCEFTAQSAEQTDVSQSDLNNSENVTNHKQKCLINNTFEIVDVFAILLKNHYKQEARQIKDKLFLLSSA